MIDTLRACHKITNIKKSEMISIMKNYGAVEPPKETAKFRQFYLIIEKTTRMRFLYYPNTQYLVFEVSIPRFLYSKNIHLLDPKDLQLFKKLITNLLNHLFPLDLKSIDDWDITRFHVCFQKKYDSFEDAINIVNTVKKVFLQNSSRRRKTKTNHEANISNKSRTLYAAVTEPSDDFIESENNNDAITPNEDHSYYLSYEDSAKAGNDDLSYIIYLKELELSRKENHTTYNKNQHTARVEFQYTRIGLINLTRPDGPHPVNDKKIGSLLKEDIVNYIIDYNLNALKINLPIREKKYLWNSLKSNFTSVKSKKMKSELNKFNKHRKLSISRTTFYNYSVDLQKLNSSIYYSEGKEIDFNTYKRTEKRSSIDKLHHIYDVIALNESLDYLVFRYNFNEIDIFQLYNYNKISRKIEFIKGN